MKTFVASTAFALVMLGANFSSSYFSSTAYAKHKDNSNVTKVCRSIPQASPTGGGTRERMAAIERCNKAQLREREAASTNKPATRTTIINSKEPRS